MMEKLEQENRRRHRVSPSSSGTVNVFSCLFGDKLVRSPLTLLGSAISNLPSVCRAIGIREPFHIKVDLLEKD